jgi:hypothetical protein
MSLTARRATIVRKRYKAEEIVAKLRQVDVLTSQGQSLADAIRRLRDELLDGEIFHSLPEAQIVIESWRRHYNRIRPHPSLGYKPPAPKVFVPALAAWPAALRGTAPPAALALKPTLN